MDILFKTPEWVFSYRVAGLAVRDGKVLLQKPDDDDGYAVPGGHVALGETNKETLRREFMEETGCRIAVGRLLFVGELFFPWGDRTCHQICLYYEVSSPDFPEIPEFPGTECPAGQESSLRFYWVPLSRLASIPVYPENLPQLMRGIEGGAQHFVYREE